ncbi:hypothetical protein HQ587_10215 [bacterium]|nr:hypothetical protein [bacterium]
MPSDEVVIVGKTKAGSMICIGALSLTNAVNFRLKDRRFPFWDEDVDFEIGQCYKLKYRRSKNRENPHHVEDVVVLKRKLLREMSREDIADFIRDKGRIVESEDPRYVFRTDNPDHPMILDGRSIYAPESSVDQLLNSVGFWISPFGLRESSGSYYGKGLRIKYVGVEPAVAIIKSGSIIRLSTATLWSKPEFPEPRSYLQLSGWF